MALSQFVKANVIPLSKLIVLEFKGCNYLFCEGGVSSENLLT
jgi:hypothetical protein